MNERIRLLAVQVAKESELYCAVPIDMNKESYQFLAQVLSELIVRECAGLNKHQSYELMGVITDVEEGDVFDDVCLNTVKRVAEHLANDLKEHFGVE